MEVTSAGVIQYLEEFIEIVMRWHACYRLVRLGEEAISMRQDARL